MPKIPRNNKIIIEKLLDSFSQDTDYEYSKIALTHQRMVEMYPQIRDSYVKKILKLSKQVLFQQKQEFKKKIDYLLHNSEVVNLECGVQEAYELGLETAKKVIED